MDKSKAVIRKDYDLLILDTLMSIDPEIKTRINDGLKAIINNCSDVYGKEYKKCVWAEIEKSKQKIRWSLRQHDSRTV